jgi:F0F1-type ATP synthase assembly protein I
MNWELYFKIINILQDESWHFGLSAISGCVAFLLILTMFGVVLWLASVMSRSRVSATREAKRFIIGLGLLFGLLAVWASHTLLDLFVYYYNMPLGPHLPLVLKGG